MMGGNSDGVKAWLRSRHISVLGEWVDACIQWIHEEHQGTVLSGSQLCKMVYEQWLDSDLTEIATPCLPQGIREARKTQLKGNYALQVNCVQDISTPAYAQLTKLQGRENENATVTATQGKFEPHSSRMLMLSLTDGQETIQAMEYKHVPCLTSDLNPGSKIMLSGDMQCRLGVILLTPTHIKVLGGEVEALKENNSKEKILARAIGVTPPDRPASSNNQHQGTTANPATATTATANTTTTTRGQVNTATTNTAAWNPAIASNQRQQPNQHTARPQNTSKKAPVKQEPYHGTKNTNASSHQQGWNQGHPRPTQGQPRSAQGHPGSIQGHSRAIPDVKPAVGHQGFEDAFMEEEEDGFDELMLEELENLERKEAQKIKTEVVPTNHDWDVEDINEEELLAIEEEELLAMEWESNNKQVQNVQRQNNPKAESLQRLGNASNSINGDNQSRGSSSNKPFLSVSHRLSCSDRTTKPLGKTKLPVAPNTSPSFASNVVPLFKREVKPMQNSASRTAQGHQRTELPEIRPTVSSRLQNTERGDEHVFGRADRGVQLPGSSKMAVATRIVKSEPVSQPPQRDVIQISDSRAETGTSSKESEGRDFVSAQSLVKREVGENAPKRMRIHSGPRCNRPFVYLIDMADQLSRKEACRFDVKGFIMTLVSSLSHNPTWNLTAKINDGTMSLDVDISDEVLTKMIGFTVDEMLEMKANMKTYGKQIAQEIKETIKQGIARCQQALIDLSCILTLEVKPEYPRPVMIAVRQPTMDDCNAFRRYLDESKQDSVEIAD